jgi:hypothetical protein
MLPLSLHLLGIYVFRACHYESVIKPRCRSYRPHCKFLAICSLFFLAIKCLIGFLFVYKASFVKMATCRFALEEFVEALPALEECFALTQHGARSISDQRQQAEVLNNLGCLTYICGQPERALELFFESFQVQSVALDHSLYSGARFSCHSATLNMSVTKGNSK